MCVCVCEGGRVDDGKRPTTHVRSSQAHTRRNAHAGMHHKQGFRVHGCYYGAQPARTARTLGATHSTHIHHRHLNRVAAQQAGDSHGPCLADAVHACHGLLLYCWVRGNVCIHVKSEARVGTGVLEMRCEGVEDAVHVCYSLLFDGWARGDVCRGCSAGGGGER